MPSTGKPYIDFGIYNSYDPKYLVVADHSDYKTALATSVSTISIKLPGSKNFQLFPFAKNKRTLFNSNTLHTTCVRECEDQCLIDLPDGIYTILIEVSPNDLYFKQRYYLKLDRTRVDLDKIYIKSNINYSTKDKELREDLANIEFMIRSAEAFTRDGDFSNAQMCFEEVQNLIKKNGECKSCL